MGRKSTDIRFCIRVANIKEWTQYTDYSMSILVKHKQFYYTANKKLKGSATFVDADWTRLDGAPRHFTNFDYRTTIW